MSTPSQTTDNSQPVVERRSIDYIPQSERHGKSWHLWSVWFCGEAHLTTLAVGVIGISMGTNLLWTSLAIILGCAFGTLFMAGHSAQGPHMGLPQLIQSRPQFGYLGALLIYCVALVTYIGYNAFNQVLAGQTLHSVTSAPEGPSALAFTLLALVMAFFGYQWFHKLQRWLSYVTIVGLAVLTVGIAVSGIIPAEQLSMSGFALAPFLAQFFTAAAYQLSWAIYVSDYSRYLPQNVNTRSTFWWTYFGAALGGTWMMLIGAAATTAGKEANVTQALMAAGDTVFPGFGPTVVLLALVVLITSAAQNFYGGSLTLLSILATLKPQRVTFVKRVLALAVTGGLGVAVAAAASDDFLNQFQQLLALLLCLFTPWTAVNLIDYYWVRRGRFSLTAVFEPDGMYGRWGWRGLLSYGLGFVAMLPFAVIGTLEGPVARMLGGADVSMPVGLLVAGAVYLYACRSLDAELEISLIAELDPTPAPEDRPDGATGDEPARDTTAPATR